MVLVLLHSNSLLVLNSNETNKLMGMWIDTEISEAEWSCCKTALLHNRLMLCTRDPGPIGSARKIFEVLPNTCIPERALCVEINR